MIRPACSFNGLSVAEIAHPQPLRDGTIDKPSAACAEPILEHKNTVLMPSSKRTCSELVVTMITASPVSPHHASPWRLWSLCWTLNAILGGRYSSLRHKYSGLMISRRADASVSTTFSQSRQPPNNALPRARFRSLAHSRSAFSSGRLPKIRPKELWLADERPIHEFTALNGFDGMPSRLRSGRLR